jgi:predicted 2-oxoglutarate/Fe(II)-dependent dioxygenase YbiX
MNTADPNLIPGFLDPAICREVRTAMDRGAAEAAEILDQGVAVDEDVRRASNIDVDPCTLAAVEARLDAASDMLSVVCGVPLIGREGAGFIRYSDGGFYRPHRDRGDDAEWPTAARRRLAVVVFLNSAQGNLQSGDFLGGELVIYPGSADDGKRNPIRITPREGLLVAFDAALLHEVRPVVEGTRDVIVDWYYDAAAEDT